MRYHNNEWQELTTTLTNEDTAYVYYEAETTGLSTFAIVGSEVVTALPLFIYIIILAVVIAAIVIIGVLYKKKIF
ncbi:hypothetical protein MBGDN05_00152 [Thermoplasmatales archaeon SCGC AB-539-N05]|nr:hypothetical protein MBGDN05_00152 [Thermoplasmatales archaeon SCGC AB-539-N05]